MRKWIAYRRSRQILMSFILACLAVLLPQIALAQAQVEGVTIDPRLQELVEIVKSRADAPASASEGQSSRLSQDEINLDLIKQLQADSSVSYTHLTLPTNREV